MIDLHIHSKYSDGILNITQIESEASKSNISILSITDHDNIESVDYIKKYKLSNVITFIPGIEMSTESYFFGDKIKIHLLGYNYDSNNKLLNKALLDIYSYRANANKEYILKLIKKFNYLSIDMFTDFDYGKHSWINKQILNRIYKTVEDSKINEIKEYLRGNKPHYIKYNFKIEEAIDILNNADGYSVIAHPHELKLSNNKLEELLKYLIDCGLKGIETYHNYASSEEVAYYHSLATKYNLYESGVSDFHNYENNQSIGCIYSELNYDNKFIKKLIKENKIKR